MKSGKIATESILEVSGVTANITLPEIERINYNNATYNNATYDNATYNNTHNFKKKLYVISRAIFKSCY